MSSIMWSITPSLKMPSLRSTNSPLPPSPPFSCLPRRRRAIRTSLPQPLTPVPKKKMWKEGDGLEEAIAVVEKDDIIKIEKAEGQILLAKYDHMYFQSVSGVTVSRHSLRTSSGVGGVVYGVLAVIVVFLAFAAHHLYKKRVDEMGNKEKKEE